MGFVRRRPYSGKITIELHTGGWSGNEDLIRALQKSYFWSFWRISKVGGHYYFKIPLKQYEELPDAGRKTDDIYHLCDGRIKISDIYEDMSEVFEQSDWERVQNLHDGNMTEDLLDMQRRVYYYLMTIYY